MNVGLSTATFNSWTTGGPDYGLAVWAATSGNLSWKRFDSDNSPHPPYLTLNYTPDVPPQVNSQYPPDNYQSPSLTPELIASGSDPDNWPSPVKYQFTVYTPTGTQVATSGLVSSGDWVVPAGLSQNNGSHGFDPSVGNYTTTATDANVQTAGPSLSVTRDYNSLDPRISGAFGAGWSSLYDMKATEVDDAAGTRWWPSPSSAAWLSGLPTTTCSGTRAPAGSPTPTP